MQIALCFCFYIWLFGLFWCAMVLADRQIEPSLTSVLLAVCPIVHWYIVIRYGNHHKRINLRFKEIFDKLKEKKV